MPLIRKQHLLPKGHRNRPGNFMNSCGVLFHTTNNWKDGSGDEMHGEYMANQKERVVSWHYTIDKDSWTQHIPTNENAWHAGDGSKGIYNLYWIGVEISCEAVAPGEKLDRATYWNAVEAIALIMEEEGHSAWERLQPHKVVYGKDCPHHTLIDHGLFKKDVFKCMVAKTLQPKLIKPAPVIDYLAGALKVLSAAGVVNSPEYWLKNARLGKEVNGEYVNILIQNMAAKLRGGEKV